VAFQAFLLLEVPLAVSEERTINFRTMGYEPSWLSRRRRKARVGAVSASRCNGKCLFVMPTESDLGVITKSIAAQALGKREGPQARGWENHQPWSGSHFPRCSKGPIRQKLLT